MPPPPHLPVGLTLFTFKWCCAGVAASLLRSCRVCRRSANAVGDGAAGTLCQPICVPWNGAGVRRDEECTGCRPFFGILAWLLPCPTCPVARACLQSTPSWTGLLSACLHQTSSEPIAIIRNAVGQAMAAAQGMVEFFGDDYDRYRGGQFWSDIAAFCALFEKRYQTYVDAVSVAEP